MNAFACALATCLVGFLFLGCRSAGKPTPPGGDVEEELFRMDREYCAAVQERGIDGWASVYAEDGAKLALGGGIARGPREVAAEDASMFADPSRALTWEPVAAHAYADGRLGFTTGRWRFVQTSTDGTETVLATGNYVTMWRRENGTWKVILDTGAADPPPTR